MARVAGAAALLALACAPAPRSATAATVVDAVGRRVELPASPLRLVSLAPNITEILFALGVGDRVVGVTTLCDWPPAARAAAKVGGVITPSLEAVVGLAPDLVFATADGNRSADVHRLAELGLAVYVIDTRSLDDVLDALLALGALTGSRARARELAADLALRRDAVRARVGGAPPVAVFVALERSPLITAGPATFVGEMLELAGGRNVVGDSPVKYPVYSLERLLADDPDVIVDAADPQPVTPEAVRGRWEGLPGAAALSAVRGGRLVSVGQATFFRPGPRIMDSLERLAEILHPAPPDEPRAGHPFPPPSPRGGDGYTGGARKRLASDGDAADLTWPSPGNGSGRGGAEGGTPAERSAE